MQSEILYCFYSFRERERDSQDLKIEPHKDWTVYFCFCPSLDRSVFGRNVEGDLIGLDLQSGLGLYSFNRSIPSRTGRPYLKLTVWRESQASKGLGYLVAHHVLELAAMYVDLMEVYFFSMNGPFLR